jgi:type VI secretion system secreted protein VgrG
MSSFDEAVAFVLKNEGGFVDNPKDPGGATNHGISLRLLKILTGETLKKCGIFHDQVDLTPDIVRELTLDQAKLVYKFVFWEAAPFDKLEFQPECSYIFDMAVHHGVGQAIKLVQRAIWDVYEKREYAGLVDDGILGDHTLNEISTIDGEMFRTALIAGRVGFVRMLCEVGTANREFLNGWIDRCYRWQ